MQYDEYVLASSRLPQPTNALRVTVGAQMRRAAASLSFAQLHS
eukprot:SAG11_NODE_36774_length_260_cov_0.540373_1_plen_42_part_10